MFWKGREGVNYTFLEKNQLSRSRRVWNRIGKLLAEGFLCFFVFFEKHLEFWRGRGNTHVCQKKCVRRKMRGVWQVFDASWKM